MKTAFFVIGFGLNVIGTVIVGIALWRGALKHADRELLPKVAAARAAVGARIRANVLRRTQMLTATGRSDVGIFSSSEASLVTVIPDADAPIETQIAYLRGQVSALDKRIGAQREEMTGELETVHEALKDARRDAQAAVLKVEEMARDIATGTIPRQVLGLFLIGLGTVIGAIPGAWNWC